MIHRAKPSNRLRPRSPYRHRLLSALGMLLVITTIGAAGYHLLEGWPWLDSIYMTIISMTTVGYGETRALSPAGRVFTMALLISSIGTVGYAVSTLASFIVEGELNQLVQGRRMDKRIANLKNHIILCGGGRTGKHIAEEFFKTKTPFVVIEQNPDVLQQVLAIGDMVYLQADATQDETLLLAGIKRASGLVAVLGSDKENIFIVLSARSLNPSLRIVARINEEENEGKMRRAGADEAVSPNAIGGLRMASEMIRPTVVDFLDEMLRSHDQDLRVDEIQLAKVPAMAGKTLGELNIGARTGMLVMALKKGGRDYQFNPGANTLLEIDDVLIVMGTCDQIAGCSHWE